MDVCGCVLDIQARLAMVPFKVILSDGLAIFTRARDARWSRPWHLKTDQARNGYCGWVPARAPVIVSILGS